MADNTNPEFEYRCTICSWSKDQPELHKYVLDLVKEGKPAGTIHKLIGEYVVNTKLPIKPPSKKSVWTHFKEHLRVDDKVQALMSRNVVDLTKTSADAITREAVETLAAKRVNDYEEMCTLYNEIEGKCQSIYNDDNALKTEIAGVIGWSQSKIQTYMMVINTRKSILAEISKMRQSEHVIKLATQFVMERFTESLVQKLLGEFVGLGEQLKRSGVNREVMKAYEEATSRRLAELITNEADSAMELTRKEFRIQ